MEVILTKYNWPENRGEVAPLVQDTRAVKAQQLLIEKKTTSPREHCCKRVSDSVAMRRMVRLSLVG